MYCYLVQISSSIRRPRNTNDIKQEEVRATIANLKHVAAWEIIIEESKGKPNLNNQHNKTRLDSFRKPRQKEKFTGVGKVYAMQIKQIQKTTFTGDLTFTVKHLSVSRDRHFEFLLPLHFGIFFFLVLFLQEILQRNRFLFIYLCNDVLFFLKRN